MDAKPPSTSSKPEPQRLTGLKKRQQIEVAGKVMFIWVAIAAAALSFCVATGQFLFTRWQHNHNVMEAKGKALATLQTNISNTNELTKKVDALVANEPLASVKTNPSDPNTKSVLDALPTTFDPAALATSLQQAILSRSGVTIENISVPQEVDATGQAVTDAVPQEMKFSFIVSGNYESVKTMLLDIERTIRPIKITSINLAGSDTNLRAAVEAVTYYQPPKTVKVGEEVIK